MTTSAIAPLPVGRRAEAHPIVVAVGPAQSDDALSTAARLAERLGRPLAITSVVAPPALVAFDTQHFALNRWKLEQLREARLAEVRAQVQEMERPDAPIADAAISVHVGDPSSVIAGVASESEASLLVMGIGPHGLRHRLLGAETMLKTAHRFPCPVLAVHEQTPDPYRCVVIGIDFSVESIYAARTALELLPADTMVHLVHVWKRISTPVPVAVFREADADYERALAERFVRVRAILWGVRSVNIETHVLEGESRHELLAAAKELGADLIVAGMRGLGSLTRLFVGSVSTAIVRGAECSVLVVPEPDVATRNELSRMLDGQFVDPWPEHWAGELQEFAGRNRGRRATLEVDDHALGAQRPVSGFRLVGATYDSRDDRVQLMFGGDDRTGVHLTHTVAGVRSISVKGPVNSDRALCIDGDCGRAIVTFLQV